MQIMLDLDWKGLLVLTWHVHNECVIRNKNYINVLSIAQHGEISYPKSGVNTHEQLVVDGCDTSPPPSVASR